MIAQVLDLWANNLIVDEAPRGKTITTITMPRMSAEELEQFLYSHFPDTAHRALSVLRVDEKFAQVRLRYDDRHLRPGGTISGPSLMMLADMAMYMALLGMIGPVALAVTTNLNINFLRKPAQADVIAECKLLKNEPSATKTQRHEGAQSRQQTAFTDLVQLGVFVS